MRIIVSYNITRDSRNPGFCDVGMSYVLGLRRLGHEVTLVDEVEPKRCYDHEGRPVNFEAWDGRQEFEAITTSYNVWPQACLLYDHGRATHGLSFDELIRIAKSADLLLTISGRVTTPEILEAPNKRAYVDINPAKTQVYDIEHDVPYGFEQYDTLLTVGLNIGTSRSSIPTGERKWFGIIPPVYLPSWPSHIDQRCQRFTTISTWAGRNTFNLRGVYSGEKSDQWKQFLALPTYTKQIIEIALNIKKGYQEDRKLFEEHGWVLSDPGRLRTFEAYREFIAASRGEVSVANQRYVQFNTGWLSDRSVRYLASGKPVLVQSTGLEDHLPTGRGLLTFRNLDEAADGFKTINSDYLAHCRAAREIAETYCDSDKVLGRMLEQIGFGKSAKNNLTKVAV